MAKQHDPFSHTSHRCNKLGWFPRGLDPNIGGCAVLFPQPIITCYDSDLKPLPFEGGTGSQSKHKRTDGANFLILLGWQEL
jgi:hypothetical protein